MPYEHPVWLASIPRPRLDDGVEYERRWWAAMAVSFGIVVFAMDVTILGIAAPALAAELGATSSEIQWAFDSYAVVIAGFVLLGGGLADRYGRKGVLQVGLALFAVGSLVAALADTSIQLLAGRAISGFGAALILPPALSLLGVMFDDVERPRAISIWASFGAVALAAGPVVGGILLSQFWFGSIFMVNIPICVLALVAVAFLVPTSRRPERVGLDVVGAVLSVLALGGLVFAIIEGPVRGWFRTDVVVAFAVGAAAAVVFVAWELRTATPLFDPRVFANVAVIAGALGVAATYVTFNGGVQLLIPQYLQYVEALSVLQTAFVLLPVGVLFGILSPLSNRMVDRYGLERLLGAALSLMVAGLAILALVATWGGVGNVLLGLLVFTAGFAFVIAPGTAAIMGALPVAKAGDGSGVNQLSRQVGAALGVAVIGSIASVIYRADLSLAEFDLSPAQASAVESSLSGTLTVEGELDDSTAAALDAMADAAMTKGVQWAMLFAAAFTAAAALAAVGVLRRSANQPQ